MGFEVSGILIDRPNPDPTTRGNQELMEYLRPKPVSLVFAAASAALLGALIGVSGSHAATVGFDIVLNYTNAPTPSQAAAFASAEATWEGIISGYQIDDIDNTSVTITVNLGNIDGTGGILGSAGPETAKLNAAETAVTSNFLYTSSGSMTFDTSDTANLELNGSFGGVILHEMGHVLGIGTLWSSSNVGFPGRQELYVVGSGQYTGQFGLSAYNNEFGQAGAFVPVELGGGGGTANGHWNEVDGGAGNTGIVSQYTGQDFKYELMTGWLNAPLFISSLTVEGMRDLGYTLVPEPTLGFLLALGCIPLFYRKRRKPA